MWGGGYNGKDPRIENGSASETFERFYYPLVSRFLFLNALLSHLSCSWYYPITANNTVEVA